jgi:hypothetical protein
MSAALQRATFWDMPAGDMAAHFAKSRQEAAQAVALIPPAPVTGSAVVAFRPRRRVTGFRGYNDFMPAFRAARERAMAAQGPRWWMSPDHSIWARVPAGWVTWKGRASSGMSPRDVHFPMAQYWPGGVLPIGPDYAAPISVAQFADPAPRRRVTIDLELLADAAD